MKRIAFAQKFEPWADLAAFGVTMVLAVTEALNDKNAAHMHVMIIAFGFMKSLIIRENEHNDWLQCSAL